MNKIVLIYAYYETPSAQFNMSFFVTKLRDNIDYVFIINGYTCNVSIPERSNITVIKRQNTGWDYYAYRVGIDHVISKDYDYYFFVNGGVFGPVLPSYNQDMDWTKVFTSKINDKVKVVGTSIICLEHNFRERPGEIFPAVEGFFFVMDKIALKILLKDSQVFDFHHSKDDAVIHGEHVLSRTLFKYGYTIDCLLRKYQGIDWTDTENLVNKGIAISRPNFYSLDFLYQSSLYPDTF
jgi:hypothetical protein